MSRYGVFVCHTCKVSLFLGKAVYREDGSVRCFWHANPQGLPNSQNPTLNRVIWKLLADHANHSMQVITEGSAGYEEAAEYSEIGGDTFKDISFEKYLEQWEEAAPKS